LVKKNGTIDNADLELQAFSMRSYGKTRKKESPCGRDGERGATVISSSRGTQEHYKIKADLALPSSNFFSHGETIEKGSLERSNVEKECSGTGE
jgi:hypothetical protein